MRETASGADARNKAVRFILAAKLFSAPYAKGFDVRTLSLSDETQIIVANYIAEREEAGERIRPSELFELLDENSNELNEILDLSYGDKLTGEVAEKFFFDSVRTIEREDIEAEINTLTAEYKAETDNEKRKAIAVKLTASSRSAI